MGFSACNYEIEQMFDRKREPVAPVLTVEGASTFVITEDLPDFYYTVLTWSRANFGKGVSADYHLMVSDDETFLKNVQIVSLGADVTLRALSAAELYRWAVDDYGVYNSEEERNDPATLYFRVAAYAVDYEMAHSNPISSSIPVMSAFSNVESIACKWEENEPWEPVDLKIFFKVVSGDWGEYAVYAWGDAEVYGNWPGQKLEEIADGWYFFVVPKNRPINLIINNNGGGRQFDFLKDDDLLSDRAFEFEINGNSCVWKEVEIPSGEPALYIIGEEFGGWNWSSDGVVEMTPVNGFEGHFWAVRSISAGKGFKWCRVRDWNGDFYSLGENIGYTVSGGNAYVAEDGMYMVYVDTVNGKISVEPARVYGIGPCFGGWDASHFPFEVSGKTMTRTTTGSGDLRIYAASNIAPVGGDWWRMEFVVLDGKIAYRGNGGDQARVQVEAGKMVELDFNAGTGTFK